VTEFFFCKKWFFTDKKFQFVQKNDKNHEIGTLN
jgi:hypothetical protein